MVFVYYQAVSVFCGTYLFILVKAINSNNYIHSQSLLKNLGGGQDKPAGIGCPPPGLEKSSVLPVLDRFLKLKTDLFLNKKLKSRSIKLCISQDFAILRLTLSPVRIVHT